MRAVLIKFIYFQVIPHNVPLNFILLPIQCGGGDFSGSVMKLNDVHKIIIHQHEIDNDSALCLSNAEPFER